MKMTRLEGYRLSPQQSNVWRLRQELSHSNWVGLLSIEGTLDVDKLRHAMEWLVERHEVLRTYFHQSSDAELPLQVIHDAPEILFDVVEISHHSQPEQIAFRDKVFTEQMKREIALEQPLTLHCKLLVLDNQRQELVITLPPSCADASTIVVIAQELGRYYQLQAEQISPLNEPIQYADFAALQDSENTNKKPSNLNTWMDRTLQSYPSPPLFSEAETEDGCRFIPECFTLDQNHTLNTQIKALAGHCNTDVKTLLLSCWQILLWRLTGERNIVVWKMFDDRESELNDLPGLYSRWLPIHGYLDGKLRLDEITAQTSEAVRRFSHYEDYFSWGAYTEQQSLAKDHSQSPFAFEFVKGVSSIQAGDARINVKRQYNITDTFRIKLSVLETATDLSVELHYDGALYAAPAIERIALGLRALLEGALVDTATKVAYLPVINTVEERKILTEWNETEHHLPSVKLVHQLFQEHATHCPERVAIEYRDICLTYEQLDHESNKLANYLRQVYQVKAGDIIGLLGRPSECYLITFLAVLKAGAVYLPVDRQYPADRQEFIVRDADVKLLFLDDDIAPFDITAPMLSFDYQSYCGVVSSQTPAIHVDPDDLAYVIYTSGTTGMPKGAMLTHKGLRNLVFAQSNAYGKLENERVLQFASFGFDASISNIIMALAQGGTLCLVDREDARPGPELLNILQLRDISVFDTTPSVLTALDRVELPHMRLMISAGDSCSSAVVDKWTGDHRLFNAYGPTEATVWASSALSSQFPGEAPPIGRPIANVQLYVLDDYQQPLPIGAPGELLIGGVGLARGYLGKPGLTAEKFIPHPFTKCKGERLYRTGDLVRFKPDGNIEFLGRIDHQVKIRGFRIEIEEIELQLLEHLAIRETFVMVREDQPGDKRLTAYLVQQGNYRDESLEGEQLSEWKETFEEIDYEDEGVSTDPEFNIAGWSSSVTGEAIDPQEMRLWVDQTVDRIRALDPSDILEIGCGTGLLLFPLAADSARYTGIDFSEFSLSSVQNRLQQRTDLHERVHLHQRAAHQLQDFEEAEFDTVILNSVIQYFPSLDYFLYVIESVLPKVATAGRIFLGDIRCLSLNRAFHTSIALEHADPELTLNHLNERIEAAMNRDRELVLDPKLFTALTTRFERITRVEIKPKRGGYINELNCFRYDVILHLDQGQVGVEPPWQAWQPEVNPVEAFYQIKVGEKSGLYFRDVANSRVSEAALITDSLCKSPQNNTVEQFQDETLTRVFEEGIDPEQWWQLESDEIEVDISWARGALNGCYDVVVRKRNSTETAIDWGANEELSVNWSQYANVPVGLKLNDELLAHLKEQISSRLPNYMVPSAFVFVDALPLTVHGKIDRDALPAPEYSKSVVHNKPMADEHSPTEEILISTWKQVLGLKQLGIKDDFFAVGGHSLLATQVISRVNKIFNVELSVRSLFEAPTVKGMSQAIADAKNSTSTVHDCALQHAPDRDKLPLSFAQQRLWFLDQMEPQNSFYNMPAAVRMRGELDAVALQKSINEIVRRHECLRTKFENQQGHPIQIVYQDAAVIIPTIDLSSMSDHDRETEAHRVAMAEFSKPFDLAQGPLIRMLLIRLAEHHHIVLLTLHHIVSDGWSIGIFVREFAALYEQFSTGSTSQLPELPIQYADFAYWQRQWLEGEILEKQLSYWKRQLADAPATLDLPTDFPRPAVQTFNGSTKFSILPRKIYDRLEVLSQEQGATVFMTLVAAFQIMLYRYSGQLDVCVGTPIANREREELESLIGFFVNTLVLRTQLDSEASFSDILSRVRESAIGAYDNQDVPFERVVEALKPQRDLSRSPLFQVWFALQNAPMGSLKIPGVTLSLVDLVPPSSKFDLSVSAMVLKEGLHHVWEFNTDLFKEETISRFMAHFEGLLEAIVDNPEMPIGSLNMLSTEERSKLLVDWNNTKLPAVPEQTLLELFNQQVRLNPDRIAIKSAEQQRSYRALEDNSNRLARYLSQLGVKRGALVGVGVARSVQMVETLLAVMKVGAAYVPLDPTYPQARLRLMIEDSQMELLVADEDMAWAEEVGNVTRVVQLSEEQAAIDQLEAMPLSQHVSALDPAYVIYTSGSTGKPKGVQISHKALSNFLISMQDNPGIHEKDVLLAVTSLSFDIAGLEIYLPLITGAMTIIASNEEARDGFKLAKRLQSTRATIMQATPATWRMLIASGWQGNSSIKILCGGEKLPPDLAKQMLEWGADIYNLYGPTETTIWSTLSPVTRNALSTIGTPIANTRCYLLDDRLNVVPIGARGELYIAGDGLANGYFRQQALTSERFVPDPFSSDVGARMYRTGDLARYASNGDLEYLGRRDQQVKIRGYRIETGEIENLLRLHPAVAEAVVTEVVSAPNEHKLVAYVAPATDYGDLIDNSTKQNIQAKHIAQWQRIWDKTYEQPYSAPAQVFNTADWTSSFTGKQIAPEQMRLWVTHTLDRILALSPSNVLEIGCGTGLLTLPLAHRCRHYVGLDISSVSIQHIKNVMSKHIDEALPVELLHRQAHQLDDLAPGSFDTAIINSVVQYFPDLDYLLSVLDKLIPRMEEGGNIFLGDIRSLTLFETFLASVELARATDDVSLGELRQRIAEAQERESELLLDARLFSLLRTRWPRIGQIEVLPKRGGYDNEISHYRYDVILHLDSTVEYNADVIEWEPQLTPQKVVEQIHSGEVHAMRLKNVLNRRVQHAVAAIEILRAPGRDGTVGELRNALGELSFEGIDPEQWWQIGQNHDLNVSVSWATGNEQGNYDVCIGRQAVCATQESYIEPRQIDLSIYANCPLSPTTPEQLTKLFKAHLVESLPEYMVPSAFFMIKQFPLTPNGKLDRNALKNMKQNNLREHCYVEPRSEVERTLAAIYSEVLNKDPIGINDNFFDLGGHSLLATQVVSKIRDTFDLDISLRLIFEAPIIIQLAEQIEHLCEQSTRYKRQPLLTRKPGQTKLPLSFSQERLWFLDRLEQGSSAYNMPIAVRVQGKLDRAALDSTITEIFRRHEVLRTRFGEVDGEPVQMIQAVVPQKVEYEDLRTVSANRQYTVLSKILLTESSRPFVLIKEQLCRVRLVQLSADTHVVLITMHHIISDGWSIDVFIREVRDLYQAFISGIESPLAELSIQYADFALWQRAYLQGDVLEQLMLYWRKQLSGMPHALEIPTDKPRPNVPSFHGASRTFAIEMESLTLLRELSRREDVTMYMLLLAAFQVVLGRWSGQNDVVVGSPIAGRTHQETEAMIGFFTNTLVMRTDLSGDPSFETLLSQVRETTLDAYAHQDLPFEKLVAELQPHRDLSRQPLFQVMFTLQNQPASELKLPGLSLSPIEGEYASSKFDLSLDVFETEDTLWARVDYATDLFEAGTIERLIDAYKRVLEAVGKNSKTTLTRLPLMSQQQYHQILVDWNNTDREHASKCLLHELFTQQASKTPDALAVVHGSELLTYKDLDLRSNRFAHYLTELGVRPDSVVAMCIPWSVHMLVGILGVLKAGGAVLPLDPASPSNWLGSVLEHSNAQTLVTDGVLSDVLSNFSGKRVQITADWPQIARNVADPLRMISLDGDNLAYVIYNSESSDGFEGALLSHENLVNYLNFATDNYCHTNGCGAPVTSPFSSDATITSMWLPLTLGQQVVLLPGAVTEDDATVVSGLTGELAAGSDFSMVKLTSAHLSHLQHVSGASYQDVAPKLLVVRGKTLDFKQIEYWQQHSEPFRLINEYGPSETTVGCTTYELASSEDHRNHPIPIGRPIDNTKVYVLDERMEPVPIGVIGELYIAGKGVSRGYLGRPALTAERFIPNPFGETGTRLYRSGDQARYLSDGNLQFCGRKVVSPQQSLLSSMKNATNQPYIASRTEEEATLADMWGQVLDVKRVGLHDHFFDLGGHSLIATRLMSRIRNVFGLEVPVRVLFESPRFEDFANAIFSNRFELATEDDAILAAQIQEVYPQSEVDKLSDEEVHALLDDMLSKDQEQEK